MKKRLFQVLDAMNLIDVKNNTRLVSVCPDFISADKVKAGAKISMGAAESVLLDIVSGKCIPVLLIIDRKEYFARKDADADYKTIPEAFKNDPRQEDFNRIFSLLPEQDKSLLMEMMTDVAAEMARQIVEVLKKEGAE